jgi:hypothetical protein
MAVTIAVREEATRDSALALIVAHADTVRDAARVAVGGRR